MARWPHRTSVLRLMLGGTALAAVAIAPACSLLVQTRVDWCTSAADCAARGAGFAGTYCDDQGGCVYGCRSNAECSGGGSGDPWICRADGTCARLLSDDCATVLADAQDLADETTLWFGMLLPLDPATAPVSHAKIDAAQLARDDFNVTAGGLPPLAPSGPRRRFGYVVCDDSVQPERAARHLTDDVRVPAILGPVNSGTLIKVATDVTIGRGVLLISPSASSPFISNLPGKNGLVWRTCPSDNLQTEAMALLVSGVIEPRLRASEVPSGAPLKIAVIYDGSSYGLGFEQALETVLTFNGQDAAQNAASGTLLTVSYGNSDLTSEDAGAEAELVLEKTLAFAPHVVIIAGTQQGITGIFTPLEARWSATTGYTPLYLFSDGAYPREELLAAVGSNGDLRKRVLGTAPGTTSTVYQDFLSYYDSQIHDGTSPGLSTSATYDAAYLLAYAATALGNRPMTGQNIRYGLTRQVAPGPQIQVGPAGIDDALSVLSSGGQIYVAGTSGPLDFDVTTGDPVADIQLWCLSIDANGKASGFQNSGEYYDANARQLTGTLACP